MDEVVFEFDHVADEPGVRIAINDPRIKQIILDRVKTAEVIEEIVEKRDGLVKRVKTTYKIIGRLFIISKDGAKRRILVYSTWTNFGEKTADYKADLSELKDYLQRVLTHVGEWAFR